MFTYTYVDIWKYATLPQIQRGQTSDCIEHVLIVWACVSYKTYRIYVSLEDE